MAEDGEKRRRLKLLPEVLPAPTVSSAEESPRARTREHMQRLLTAAAITGTLACTHQAAENRGPPPVDAQPGLVDAGHAADGSPQPAADAVAPPTPDASAPPAVPRHGPLFEIVDAGAHSPHHGGYRVVDPMPPPGMRNRKRGTF